MKNFIALALVAILPMVSVSAQRITGDSSCVNACYQISVAVTQCPDLTDSGVISCICPNTTQIATLDQCHGCISNLTGVTDLESNSINTLYNACSSNSSTPASASGAANTASISQSGAGANAAASTSATPTGAAMHSAHAAAGAILTVAAAAVAAFVTL